MKTWTVMLVIFSKLASSNFGFGFTFSWTHYTFPLDILHISLYYIVSWTSFAKGKYGTGKYVKLNYVLFDLLSILEVYEINTLHNAVLRLTLMAGLRNTKIEGLSKIN